MHCRLSVYFSPTIKIYPCVSECKYIPESWGAVLGTDPALPVGDSTVVTVICDTDSLHMGSSVATCASGKPYHVTTPPQCSPIGQFDITLRSRQLNL